MVGIVASRLMKLTATVVLTKSGDVIGKQCPQRTRINLYEAIHTCREHLLGYGGHFAATSFIYAAENVNSFAAAI